MRHVAVIVETSSQYGRNLIAGISRYSRLHGWHLLFEYRGRNTAEPEWLADFEGDGVITTHPSPDHSLRLRDRGMPVIHFHENSRGDGTDQPWIDSDHHLVGRQAADHFLHKGHRHFAFLGHSDHPVSLQREAGYIERLGEAGHVPLSHHTPERASRSFASVHGGDESFLRSLPKPCALFCCWDEVAFRAVQTAIEHRIAVPEEVAVLGVDNDPVFCGSSLVPISSIDPDIPQLGFLLASRLEAMISGQSPADMGLLKVPPRRVVVRQSSALEAVADPLVRRFLELLRQPKPGTLTIEDIAVACHVSRRLLEQRVKAVTGKTPRQLLSASLVDHIRGFLLQTDYTLAHIAELLGFDHSERLSHLFRRETGVTPGEFRRSSRG
ncbi:MAG: XylR family transcriptional regulator [Akkermansiaceae bacterium]|nr:XylR family transcriptional regulator [Akkermansiaceae bacterium]